MSASLITAFNQSANPSNEQVVVFGWIAEYFESIFDDESARYCRNISESLKNQVSAQTGGEVVSKHIIKYDYREGVKLPKHEIETWCGHRPGSFEWLFQDAQHALLSIEHGALLVPCKNCLAAIIKTAQEVK